MPNTKIIIGSVEYQSPKYWELLNATLRQSKEENILTETQESPTPPMPLADSCTSRTIAEIQKSMPNFSTNSIKDLQTLVVMWADSLYANRTLSNCLDKLLEEVEELYDNPNPEELADVMLLTLDLFHLAGVDPGKALMAKMKTNEERKWKIDPFTGVMKHIEETPSQTSGD